MPIIYYLVIKPLSFLPLRVLYLFSDMAFFFLWYIFPYRKKVVLQNLQASFPGKTSSELEETARKFYRHFSDIIVETIKAFSISKQELLERFPCRNPEILTELYRSGTSIVGITAHYGNWEWAALAIGIYAPHITGGIYHPLKNKFLNRKIEKSRSRFGLHLIPYQNIQSFYKKFKNKPVFVGYIADQTPSNPRRCYWTHFLNQDTPVFLGPERMAKAFNHAVLYGKITKIKRGKYELEFEIITTTPEEEPPYYITEKHLRILENQIVTQPEYWLWTHRRWKRKRPENAKHTAGRKTSPQNLG